MNTQRPGRFDQERMLERLPRDRDQHHVGFTPWPEDCQYWRRSVLEKHSPVSMGALTRTVWDAPDDRDDRVLIDVYECQSSRAAIHSLARILEGNQLAE